MDKVKKVSSPGQKLARKVSKRLTLGGFSSSSTEQWFSAETKSVDLFSGLIKGRQFVAYKCKDELREKVEDLVIQGGSSRAAVVNEEALFKMLQEFEHVVKKNIFALVEETLTSEETNPYFTFLNVINERKNCDDIRFQAEIDDRDQKISAGIIQLEKLQEENTQLRSRLHELRTQLEKFRPYLDGAEGKLNWEALIKGARKFTIKDASSFTIEELKNSLREHELLISQMIAELAAMKSAEILSEDSLKEACDRIVVLEQEQEKSYLFYQEWEATKTELLAKMQRSSIDFEKVSFRNLTLARENQALNEVLEIQKQKGLETDQQLEQSSQLVSKLSCELEQNKEQLSALRESLVTEKIKTNAILILNASTALVPGQAYGRIVKAFEASLLASRILNYPEKESYQWLFLGMICSASVLYNSYRFVNYASHYLVRFIKSDRQKENI